MRRFPETLRHGSGVTMTLDRTRLLLSCKTPPARDGIAKRLADVALVLEDADERDDEASRRETRRERLVARVNHTDRRFWVRAREKQPIEEARLRRLEEPFGEDLDWVGPVYRMPDSEGRRGLLCPLPDTLIVKLRPQPQPAGEVLASALAAGLPETPERDVLHEVSEKSSYLGDYHYFVINEPGKYTAYALRDILLEQAGGQVLDVRFENMPLLVPTAVVPNDTYFPQQWNMTQIQAPEGWDVTTGDATVVVCILDSGCDLTHPDLQFSTPGINLGTMMPDASPVGPPGVVRPHGTSVAGVAAGIFDNGAGVAGVAGSCEIMPLAVPDWTDVQVAAGITYATDNGARVINMSFGEDAWDTTIIDPAIQHAFDNDVVMCAATHNFNGPITYPATNPLVMACGASDQLDDRKSLASPDGECWGSDYGAEMSVVAPGVLIPTTDIQGAEGYNANGGPLPAAFDPCAGYPSAGDAGGDYLTVFYGTSSATPHVAGLAALLRSAYPALTSTEVRNVIERTAEKTGTVPYAETPGYPNGTWNQEMGYGRINVFRALSLADMMIRDYPGDTGVEPSSPPGGNFWDFSDIVVRNSDDDVFVPGDPTQSKRLELGQENYLYVRVTNNGPREATNVSVSARITPWVGTQFVYPYDWTTVDATHVSPTPVTAVFASIPAGGEEIAKFTISAAQVQTLWDENWHPCLLAEVDADNDYSFDTAAFTGSPVVVKRNNLAQRNLSVIDAVANAQASFPFLAGHFLDRGRFMEIVVRREKLPPDMPLRLALDEGNRYFPQVDLTPADLEPVERGADGISFLETTRIRAKLGWREGILTLVKGSRFDSPLADRVGEVDVKGGEVILRAGQRFVDVREDRAVIRIEKASRQMYSLTLHTRIPPRAKPGTSYYVSVAQRDEERRVVGGASVVFRVG